MVFFVLSGFLISSAVIRDHQNQRWTWAKYSTDRLTRLYVVLIPGLLLTLVWDLSGLHLFGTNPIYTGNGADWINDYFDVNSRLSSTALLGNASFLQTILVQPLGSNDPLWSLAFEFWYYVLFPCLYIASFQSSKLRTRAGFLLVAIATLLFVGEGILIYFPIWLFGTFLCLRQVGVPFKSANSSAFVDGDLDAVCDNDDGGSSQCD